MSVVNLLNFKKTQVRLSEDVYIFKCDPMAHLLDFNHSRFYGLDPIATTMLTLVLEKGIEETISHVTQTYETTEEQVRTDLINLLQDLKSKKLIKSAEQLPDKPYLNQVQQFLSLVLLKISKFSGFCWRKLFNPSDHPNSLTVNLLLSLSWLSFRCLGWSRTLELWQHWHREQELKEATQQLEIVKTVDSLVRETAASKLFLPVVCKERALVGYQLLRAFYGIPASLIVGVESYPFQVHAWVEWEGMIITDDVAHCEGFTPVSRWT